MATTNSHTPSVPSIPTTMAEAHANIRDQLNQNALKVMGAANAVYTLHKLLNQATSNGMGGLRPLAVTVEERDGLMVITGNACENLREAMNGLCDLCELIDGEIFEQGQEDGSHE